MSVFARSFFENLGTSLDETRSDIYEDTAVYWAEDSYSMWINYNGGTYDMTDFDISFPEEGDPQRLQVTDATEETILNALSEYGIELPEDACFSHSIETGYTFTVERAETNGIIYDGQLTCDYYGNNKFSSIRNDIRQLETYKEFEICSEKEAYEKEKAGYEALLAVYDKLLDGNEKKAKELLEGIFTEDLTQEQKEMYDSLVKHTK